MWTSVDHTHAVAHWLNLQLTFGLVFPRQNTVQIATFRSRGSLRNLVAQPVENGGTCELDCQAQVGVVARNCANELEAPFGGTELNVCDPGHG